MCKNMQNGVAPTNLDSPLSMMLCSLAWFVWPLVCSAPVLPPAASGAPPARPPTPPGHLLYGLQSAKLGDRSSPCPVRAGPETDVNATVNLGHVTLTGYKP